MKKLSFLDKYLSDDFIRKYEVIENDLKNLKKCLCKPLKTLNTIRRNRKRKMITLRVKQK